MGDSVSTWHAPARALLAAAMLALPLSASPGQSTFTTFAHDKVKIVVTSDFGDIPPSGHMPVRIEIKNDTRAKAEYDFQFEGTTSLHGGRGVFASSFRLGADAGKTATHEVLVPVPTRLTDYHWGSSNVDVRVTRGGYPSRGGSVHSNADNTYPAIAMSASSTRLDWSTVQSRLSGGHHGGGQFGARFDPGKLPSNWLGYAGFDAMVIEDVEWEKVEANDRSAILDWIVMGGRLIVWGTGDQTRDIGIEEGDHGLGSVAFVGGASVSGNRRSSGHNPITESTFLKTRHFKIGQIASDYTGGWGLSDAFGERSFNTIQIVFILIVFGVLVGPVNLFVFAKPGRRHRLFFTTPLISVGASLLLVLLIVFQDGFGGSGYRFVATYLDSSRHKSFTTQEQVARTGVLLSRSFEMDSPASVLPLQMRYNRWTFINTQQDTRSLRYSQSGKNLSGDWFRSRSEQAHLLQKSTSTRERVEIIERGADAHPELLSSIGFPLKTICYVAGSGVVYIASNVRTGQKVELRPYGKKQFAEWWNAQISPAGLRLDGALGRASNASIFKGGKGRFFAVAAENADAGALDTLGSIDWKQTTAVIFGEVEMASAAPPEGGPAS